MHTRPRGRAALLATVLLSGLLLPVGLGAPAHAAGCTSEPPTTLPPKLPCDDAVPPETTLALASARPNPGGWVAASAMTFTFAGSHPDGETSPISFQCRLEGPVQAHDWTECTSPRSYSGLADTETLAYTFSVRAVDAEDTAYPYGLGPDTPDFDQTPATLGWGQDTVAPIAFLTPELGYDKETPAQPVVVARQAAVRVNSSERGSAVECTDNGTPVACTAGKWVMQDLSSGRHVVRARAVDKAGNPSAWTSAVEFFVPRDLARKKGWKTVRATGYLDRDALRATTRGQRYVLPRQQVRELRLYAPTAPHFGKLRVRVGRTAWRTVSLKGRKSARTEFVVISRYEGIRAGRIQIEVVTRGKPVVIDALAARADLPAASS